MLKTKGFIFAALALSTAGQTHLMAGLISQILVYDVVEPISALGAISDRSFERTNDQGAFITDSFNRSISWYLSTAVYKHPLLPCGTGGVTGCEGRAALQASGSAQSQYGNLRTAVQAELEINLPSIVDGANPFALMPNDFGIGHHFLWDIGAFAAQYDSITFLGRAAGTPGTATFYWNYHVSFSLTQNGGGLAPDGLFYSSLWINQQATSDCVVLYSGSGVCSASVPFIFGTPLEYQLEQWADILFPDNITAVNPLLSSGKQSLTIDAFNTVSLDRIVITDAAGGPVGNPGYLSEAGVPYLVATVADVPEPGTAGLLALSSLLLAARLTPWRSRP